MKQIIFIVVAFLVSTPALANVAATSYVSTVEQG